MDRGWTVGFVVTLFAIHIGRMSTDLTLLGLVSPAVAMLGDMLIAVLVTLFVVNPLYLLWRGPTRWIERRVWRRHLGAREGRTPAGGARAAAWLRWRIRSAIRMRAARFSVPATLSRGFETGLPFAAIVAATVPVWGMSWFFDTRTGPQACGTRGPSRGPTPGAKRWRARCRPWAAAPRGRTSFCCPATGRRSRRFLVHRHRRHWGGRRLAAGPPRSTPDGCRDPRCAVRRDLVRRRLSDRRNEGL